MSSSKSSTDPTSDPSKQPSTSKSSKGKSSSDSSSSTDPSKQPITSKSSEVKFSGNPSSTDLSKQPSSSNPSFTDLSKQPSSSNPSSTDLSRQSSSKSLGIQFLKQRVRRASTGMGESSSSSGAERRRAISFSARGVLDDIELSCPNTPSLSLPPCLSDTSATDYEGKAHWQVSSGSGEFANSDSSDSAAFVQREWFTAIKMYAIENFGIEDFDVYRLYKIFTGYWNKEEEKHEMKAFQAFLITEEGSEALSELGVEKEKYWQYVKKFKETPPTVKKKQRKIKPSESDMTLVSRSSFASLPDDSFPYNPFESTSSAATTSSESDQG